MQAEDLPPETKRAWLCKEQGLTAAQAARKLGTTKQCVYGLWAYARRAMKRPVSAVARHRREVVAHADALSRAGRCKCGLLLPCNSCLPTIDEVALGQRDGGDASIITNRSKSGAVTR